jgi:hypothetical protein
MSREHQDVEAAIRLRGLARCRKLKPVLPVVQFQADRPAIVAAVLDRTGDCCAGSRCGLDVEYFIDPFPINSSLGRASWDSSLAKTSM